MRGKRCLKSLLDSSKHGLVLTSIRIVFMCSSRMKSQPSSSNVYFQDKNLPFTDFIESIISLFIVDLKLFSSSSCVLPSTYSHIGSSIMCSNNFYTDIILPSSNFPYSSPCFYIALFVNQAKSCSSSGRFISNSLYSLLLVLTYGSLNRYVFPSAELQRTHARISNFLH